MPLARIITESVDDSLELSMQLRARGFRVETVSPDQIPETPADLEVRLEECAPEEMLSKAALVTENEDLWVFVAPGALEERGRPVRTISRGQPEIEWSDPEPATLPERSEPAIKASPPANDDAAILAELGFAWPKNIAPPETHPNAPAHLTRPGNASELPVAPTAESASGNGNGTAHPSPAKVKIMVLPKLPETPQIPDVPERVQPFLAPIAQIPAQAGRRFSGPYKIAFRNGSAFWKKAAVSAVLAVVVGLLALAIGVRPSLPTASKPATAPSPAPKPAPTSHSAGVVPGSKAAGSEGTPGSASGTAAKPPVPPVETHSATGIQQPTAPTQQHPAATAQRHPATQPHPPGWVSDREIIAEDTVVFYDRKPARSGKAAAKPRSDQH